MLFHPLCDTLISQVLKHVQYVYIFSFSFFFLPNELSFCTRELILRHITSRSTCNKRWRVVMAQYLTGWSSYFSAGKTLDKNFDIKKRSNVLRSGTCATRGNIFIQQMVHCASSKRITVE